MSIAHVGYITLITISLVLGVVIFVKGLILYSEGTCLDKVEISSKGIFLLLLGLAVLSILIWI